MRVAFTVAILAITLAGNAAPARAQSFDAVQTWLKSIPATTPFTWDSSQPSTVWKSVTRGAAPAKNLPNYGDFVGRWSSWLTEATNVLESAELDFVDITSLCFPEYYHRHALLRAIAYNIINKRMGQTFSPLANGAGKLNVRLLFAQYTDASRGFVGFVDSDWAPLIASDFLIEFKKAYINTWGADSWKANVPSNLGFSLNQFVEFGVVYAFWGNAPLLGAPVGGGWNHSKVVSNGKSALVGGSNLLTNYLTDGNATDATEEPVQTDKAGQNSGVVLDADLLFDGKTAILASKWVDTLFSDYKRVVPQNTGGFRELAVITFESGQDPPIGNPCDCIRNSAQPWCAGDARAYNGKEVAGLAAIDVGAYACVWTGTENGRLDDSWTQFGANVTKQWMPPAVAPGAPQVLSVGQRSNLFGGAATTNAYTPAQLAAYDTAIGRLIYSADDNPGTRILIAQQDIINGSGGKASPDWWTPTGEIAAHNTAQRWWLVERIVKELLKPPGKQFLRVFVLKSAQAAYSTYDVHDNLTLLWSNIAKRYAYAYAHPAEYGITSVPPKPTSGTLLQDQLCQILQMRPFYNRAGKTNRLHSKLVLVVSPDSTATLKAGVSIGSLNFYNALMMHDYGNIVFDDHSPGTVTRTLRDQFRDDWDHSFPTTTWSTLHPDRCKQGWSLRGLFD